MPTIRQKKIVRAMIENDGKEGRIKSLRQIALKNGYSQSLANNPKRILQSAGVIELFHKAGIDPNKIAKGYNDLMELKLETNTISVDQRRKLLSDLTKIIIDNPEQKTTPQFNFISKFLNISSLKAPQQEVKDIEIIE